MSNIDSKNYIEKFPQITHELRTCFNVEDGLSEDAAIRLYQRAAKFNPDRFEALKKELQSAFGDSQMPWKHILHNEIFEVYDAENEEGRQKLRNEDFMESYICELNFEKLFYLDK